jgi:hypothetical protein
MVPLLLDSDLPVTRGRAAKSRQLRDDPQTPGVPEPVAKPTVPSTAAPDSLLEHIRSLTTGSDALDSVAPPLGLTGKGKNKQSDVAAEPTARDTRPVTKKRSVHLRLPTTVLSTTAARPLTSAEDPHALTSEDMDDFMTDLGPATGMDWGKFDESLLAFQTRPPVSAQNNDPVSSDLSPPPPSPPTVSFSRPGVSRTYATTRTIQPQSVAPAPSPPRPLAHTSSPPPSPSRPRNNKRKVRFSEDEFVEYLSRYTAKVEDRLRKEFMRTNRDTPPIRKSYIDILHYALRPLRPRAISWCGGYLHAPHHICWDGYLHARPFPF